jgi:hypothetical protein
MPVDQRSSAWHRRKKSVGGRLTHGDGAQSSLPRNSSELATFSRSPILATAMTSCARCVRSPSDSRTSPVWPPPPRLPSCPSCSQFSPPKNSSCESSRLSFERIWVDNLVSDRWEKSPLHSLTAPRVKWSAFANYLCAGGNNFHRPAASWIILFRGRAVGTYVTKELPYLPVRPGVDVVGVLKCGPALALSL